MFNVKKQNKFWLVFIIFLTSFLIGVIFSFNVAIKINSNLLKSQNNWDILDVITNNGNLDLTEFWEVYSIIKEKFYTNGETIEKETLVEWAIKWMVEALWDKHSEYMSIEETERFTASLSWDFEWIWAVVEKTVLWVKIERIIKWSPAKKYWLLKDDIIIKANWEELQDLDLFDSVEKIKWPAWTKVLLEILRAWESDILEIEVIRDKIKIPSIDSKIIEDTNLWYISINMFWDDTDREFLTALNSLKNTEWLIIDLRDNGWWYLQKAVIILSSFIEKDKNLVTTKYQQILIRNDIYPSINDWNIYEWKIVVLINWNSASASEITAWALRDYSKAILVWEKSYWKWSVQQTFDMDTWWLLKLTIAHWYTPNDVNINHEWINPDIEVKFEKEDYENQYDRQLETAKEVLKEFINLWSLQLVVDKFNNK